MQGRLDFIDASPVTALSTWRLCLPCAFGQRASWDAPLRAIGWFGRDHCYFCATFTGEELAAKKPRRKAKAQT